MEKTVKISLKLWAWGRLQWGHEIGFNTQESEEELACLKKDNPDVDFENLAKDVRSGKLKPL